ncbi:MAG TPA: GntG family PLP-dependent aldolase, partial [Kiloniellaceae bacterium]|nr:GntG family PLP-dependent aldolase [Kiloniellaceae bacterium]
MSQITIDLYSDTHSKPTDAMRRAMASAEVGDEQQGADPTTKKLEEMVAELLGKEAALFLPSGTMCNQISFRVWCEPGDEVVIDSTCHVMHSEAGGAAALSGATFNVVAGDRGVISPGQLRAAVRPASVYAPRTVLLSVENTVNFAGGRVWPLDALQAVTAAASDCGLKRHMDGARLMNAVVASGVSAADFAATVDSCWIDLSKGLGCPVGAVLAGDRDFIRAALRFKHQFGGAMRQSGIIAAAGIHALEHHVTRLAEDHENARRLAAAVSAIPGVHLDPPEIESNMVYIDVAESGWTAPALVEALKSDGLLLSVMGPTRLRAVTHIDVTTGMVDEAAARLAQRLSEPPR